MMVSGPRLEEHMRFVCPECGVELPTQIIWRKHLNTSHEYNKKTVDVFNFKEINERYHECNECHKWVANGNQSITTLQYHRISHLPFNLTFKCRHCVQAFARKRALCDHLLDVHNSLISNINNNHEPMRTAVANIIVQQEQLIIAGSMDQLVTQDLIKSKRDPGDLIQKALLDSLIDLENETLAEYSNSNDDVNEYALNQSLNDLEAILKGDLEERNSMTQYTVSQQQAQQFTVQYTVPEIPDTEDAELLEQICDDIFEEVEEPIKSEISLPKMQQIKVESTGLSTSRDTVANEKDKSFEPYEEKIISIEIDTINESERRDMYSSPKRKRLKLELAPSRTLEMSEKIKKLLETFIMYLCPECGRQFKTQSEWREHVFKVHDLTNTMYAKFQALRNGTSHMCLDCRQVLNTGKQQELLRHRFTHMPFQSYLKCSFCGKTKSSKPKMMQHLQQLHSSTLVTPWKEKKPRVHLVCSYCDKAFQTKARLQIHRQHCSILARKKTNPTKNSNESNITSNLNLITHLKKMRARMRSLVCTDDIADKTSTLESNNDSDMS